MSKTSFGYSVCLPIPISENHANVILANVEGYTAQNYQYTVGLGNGITADDGPFLFILVNGTEFGEQVLSPEFAIKQASTTLSSSSSTSTPSSSATSSNTATTTSAKPSSSSSAASSSSSGLSTGAQAGIGVGVALGVLALLGVAFLAWRHRRRNAAASKLQEAPDNQFRGRNTNSQYAGLSPNTQYKETPQYSPRGYTSYEDMQKPGTPAGYAEAPNSEMAQIHEAPTHTPVHEAP